MTLDWHIERADGTTERIEPRYVDAAPWGICGECGSEDGTPGFVNFGCVTDDCPGCDRCDLPCITCNPNGRVR
jgi:hypothetical protein